MIEITRNNFFGALEELEKRVSQSSFISIDCEFSKLPEYSDERSFFDDLNSRYKELLHTVPDSVTLQVGLTLFKYNRDLNQYDAWAYKFHVCPSFCGRLFDPSITFVGGSVSFLCQSKFDFNKAFYEGVHCLNRSQENLVRSEVSQEGFLTQSCFKMAMEEEEVISDVLDRIRGSLPEKDDEEIEIPFGKCDSPFFRFILRRLVRKNFPRLDIVNDFENKKMIISVRRHAQITRENDIDTLIDELKGFSRVFDLLIKAKKPIVGHNLFFDLLVTYNQFYDTLPGKYASFKSSVNKLFPSMYDTKLISREFKINDKKIPNKSLKELYVHLKNTSLKDKYPKVVISKCISGVHDEHFHDAAWDAFATGFCFIRLSSLCLEVNRSENLLHAFTFSEALRSLERFKNKVNVGNANISFICLDGSDPVSRRPPFLYVKLKKNTTQSLDELDAILENYGNYQKKPLSANSVLVALANYPSFKEAVRDLSTNTNFSVEKYSFVKHSRLFKTCLLTSLLISSGLTLWMKCRS